MTPDELDDARRRSSIEIADRFRLEPEICPRPLWPNPSDAMTPHAAALIGVS